MAGRHEVSDAEGQNAFRGLTLQTEWQLPESSPQTTTALNPSKSAG
jgi:hypothetical protein